MAIIGKSVPRVDGLQKVTGKAIFTDDIRIPGMLYAKLLRSPLPHARLKTIHTRVAESMPGVVAVLTAKDFGGLRPFFGHALKDRPILAIDKVRYIGEPIACVAAEDEQTAVEALSAIEVEFEELPAVFSAEEALRDEAPLVHEQAYGQGGFHDVAQLESGRRDNICFRHFEETGDLDKAFAEADAVFEHVFTFPSVYHYAMEPHTAIADFRGDELQVWASAQHPYVVRSELAEIFGLPLNSVQITVPYLGGGFGSKSYTKIEPIAAAMSRKAGRPVKLTLTVEEAVLTNRRHAAWCWIRTGVKRDGTIIAKDAKIYLNTGAYADNGPRVAVRAATRIHGPYRIPNSRIESCAVYTNTPPCGSFRGIGAPQGTWACESQMDIIADSMGWDPSEFRQINMPRRGEVFRMGMKPMDADLHGDLDRLQEELQSTAELPNRRSAAGMACTAGEAGAGPVATAVVRMHADGTLTLMSSSSELGQGARTVLSQIAAHEMGIDLAQVRFHEGDTLATPFDRSTGASRSTTVMGTAVQMACQDLLGQMRQIASDYWGCSLDEVAAADGVVAAAGKELSYGELIKAFYGMPGGELIGRGYSGPLANEGRLANKPVFWEVGMGAAEIALDEETGVIELRRYISIADTGKAIHPGLCVTQEEGAAMMGIGHSLFEEIVIQEGQLMNANLVDYRVPTFEDLPQEMKTVLVENLDGPGPYGVRGLGEAGLIPVAPAIANALHRLTGLRIHDLPLTPERVWRALREGKPEEERA